MRALTGPASEVIDAAGQLVIPGFIEGHGHFTGIGTLALSLNLMPARSWDEIVAMVAERVKAAKPGEWIIGRGLAPGEVARPPRAGRREVSAVAEADAVRRRRQQRHRRAG